MKTMTSKERVRAALDHKEPDRVPLQGTFTPEARRKLEDYFGMRGDFRGGPWADSVVEAELGIRLGNDLIIHHVGTSSSYYASDAPTYVCPWGITWQRVEYSGGYYTEFAKHPLAGMSLEELKRWQPPEPNDEKLYAQAGVLMDRYGDDYYMVGGVACTVFETSWYLRGMEELLIDFIENKAFAHELMDKVAAFYRTAGLRLVAMGVDMIWTGDDVAGQTGMIMSPATWREFIKPRYAALFAEFKQANPDLKIAYHSDGNPTQIIPELIEIGLDVLQPVQPECMDLAWLKREFGKDLAFWGTIGIQQTLPFGTKEDVIAEVKDRMRVMGVGGGLILAPTHAVQADTSVENILAFYEAGKTYGVYGAA